MNTTELLLSLCAANGVSGKENDAAEAARALLAPLGPCETTALGSLVCRIRPAAPDKPHLLLTAHLDEIGLIVTYIDDEGFLRVSNCGGIDRSMLLASQVLIHTAGGILEGVVCTIPPHLNPDESRIPKLEEIYIDVGLSAEAARASIALGDRVTFRAEQAVLPNGRICAKSLDDRAGCAAVILAAQKLAEEPLSCGLSVALATMEEVGGQGAATAANLLAPTHAVAVDVSFGYAPNTPRHKCGELGKGPMIGISPILDNGMAAALKDAAKKADIPVQLEVMGGRTGTDADGIAVSGAGVRCALLSVPLRYMHTPIEMIEAADAEATAELIAAYVRAEFGGAQ